MTMVADLDDAVSAYLGARADTRDRLKAVLAQDPGCVMGHCLDGYLHVQSSGHEAAQRGRAALARARAAHPASTLPAREAGHLAALDAFSNGDLRGAVGCWDALLAQHPRDLVALRVSQFTLSYLGESRRMLDTVARVLPSWDAAVPGYGYFLGCHAYALEECAEYDRAEEMGRRAVELNPADIWAAHAVAHVNEMQGRVRDGIRWIASMSSEWRDCGNFALHLRWHEALYLLELEEYDRVLQLYDREVRAQPTDEYLDIVNAVSLLWRLEQADVDVGARWRELAERGRAHADDHMLVFVDLHYLMALAAAGDAAAVSTFVESCERFAREGACTEAEVMATVGLPLAQAVIAHRKRNYREVVRLLAPIRGEILRIGASHAQRDVFQQLLIDAAWRGGQLDVAAELLAERIAHRPSNMWAWKHRHAVLEALGGGKGAVGAARALERLRTASSR
jgi:tetratricopeptide (TPR) repeat protein